jgi:hypothetical protein
MYYNIIAAGYDELHLEEQKRKLKTLLTKLEVRTTDWVLDVGCGSGASFDNPAFKVNLLCVWLIFLIFAGRNVPCCAESILVRGYWRRLELEVQMSLSEKVSGFLFAITPLTCGIL